jgi:GntR family transcriptional regulator, transcriptional repressor for pyruvate dehydrogenase complex
MSKAPNSKAEYVAQRLLERISVSNVAPGSSFGTEADLLGQYDVSRPTLRESLRILESQGVLELRPGPKGGIMVKRPGAEVLAHGLSVYLRMHDVPFAAVLKVREAIEPQLAAAAAVYGSEADFAAMQASVDRMRTNPDADAFGEESRVFHALVAKAGGNKVLEIFWAMISIVAGGEEHGIGYPARTQKRVVEALQRIVDACVAHDAPAAAAAMKKHVAELETFVQKDSRQITKRPRGGSFGRAIL